MSLNLDNRQRAMLREMGVRVWTPKAVPVVAEESTPKSVPKSAESNRAAAASFATASALPAVQRAPAPTVDAPAAGPTSQAPELPATAHPGDAHADWHIGEATQLYADAGAAPGANWLVLVEATGDGSATTPTHPSTNPSIHPSANPFGNLLSGDASQLLDNMLRAARRHTSGTTLLAPLVRGHALAAGLTPALPGLQGLMERIKPDLVLVMGRLAAQALLPGDTPFNRLRGQVLALHGVAAVVTLDAAYLLLRPLDKAKAWDDLRLAMKQADQPARI